MALAVGACILATTVWPTNTRPARAQGGQAIAPLYTEAGDPAGIVTFRQEPADVMVRAEVESLPPGFHGFHVHTNGVCDPATRFASAGGHLDLGLGHLPDGSMAGDMTNLYVKADGTGVMSLRVDRFAVADLLADGGRAVVVHADPDNFRNLPDRYGIAEDQTTLDTGDAGERIACGVIQAG
jgi:Cu-Zn family superoxide dismutase